MYEVKTTHPGTGAPISVFVERATEITPEQQVDNVKKQLEVHGLSPVQEVEVTDPFTHKKKTITLDRTGTTEQKLIVALADPNLSRDQKDAVTSMYLWERGKENMSFLVDIMRFKGNYTREGRVFQDRMRMDFSTFVNSFTLFLQNQARLIGITLGVNIDDEKDAFMDWLEKKENQKKGFTYKDFYISTGRKEHKDMAELALIEMAIYSQDESQALMKAINNIAQAREAMKGGGIYVGRDGQPYSVNDPSLDEIIKKERELESEANK